MKLRPQILIAIAALTALPAQASPVRWDGNGHYYQVIVPGGPVDWDRANVEAISAGGTLATVTSAAENQFIFGLIDNTAYWREDARRYFGPWIGGYQDSGEMSPSANWRWVTGEAFSYSAWNPGEPNDYQGPGSEDRICYFSYNPPLPPVPAPYWNDCSVHDPTPGAYVVEWVPEPSSIAMLIAGAASLAVFGRRRLKRSPADA